MTGALCVVDSNPIPGAIFYKESNMAEQRKLNLYDIAHNYRVALELADESILSSIESSLKEKAKNTALWVMERKSVCAAIEEEINRMTRLLKTEENTVEWAEAWIKRSMEEANLDRLDCVVVKIGIYKNPDSIEVEPDAIEKGILPLEYIRETILKSPNKEALHEAIMVDGEIISGAKIKHSTRLSIK